VTGRYRGTFTGLEPLTVDKVEAFARVRAVFGNSNQYYNDHLPGSGDVMPSKDSDDDNYFVVEWNIR
jgi:hypothetical protein